MQCIFYGSIVGVHGLKAATGFFTFLPKTPGTFPFLPVRAPRIGLALGAVAVVVAAVLRAKRALRSA